MPVMSQAAPAAANNADPVLADFELTKKARFFPLGFPLEIATNSEKVLEAAHKSWNSSTPGFDRPPVRLELGVHSNDPAVLPELPVFRSRQHLLSIVSDAEHFIVCDLDRGFAYGWISNLAASSCPFVQRLVEASAYSMIDSLYLAPVHGALVALDGRGVLLCGDSFAGKSTLSYACARAGWTFICDDATQLLRERDDRFGIGDPHVINLRPDAPELFPELKCRPTTIRNNGKPGIEVLTGSETGIATAHGAPVHHIVFLNRSGLRHALLEPFPEEEAARWFNRHACFGGAQKRASQVAAYQRLAGAHIWQLSYSGPHEAVARLERLVRTC